jgi:hypothetical protein
MLSASGSTAFFAHNDPKRYDGFGRQAVSAMKNKDRNWIRQKLEEAFLTALAPLDNRQ